MTRGPSDWYPGAVRMLEKMPTLGKYELGYPRGAVVHFTAGRDGARQAILGGIKDGHTFLCIQKNGAVYQAHPVSEWGAHAGKSSWRGLEGRVSDELIGIEMCSAGRVTPEPDGRFRTWFDTLIEPENVRYTDGMDNQIRGYYEKFTEEQERALVELLLWLRWQAPTIFRFDLILGHDEVAGGRKTDPGAALSMTMPELRHRLKDV